jgi:hypothetical protein
MVVTVLSILFFLEVFDNVSLSSVVSLTRLFKDRQEKHYGMWQPRIFLLHNYMNSYLHSGALQQRC